MVLALGATLGTMSDLDDLGREHARVLERLEEIREDLAAAIRAERAAGATLVDLMIRSGYSSVETIRQIVDPTLRERVNKNRRAAT